MNAIAQATTAYSLVVGLICLGCSLRPAPRPLAVDLALILSGTAAVGVTVVGVVALVGGRRPAEYGTHLGYLVVLPLLLPVTAVVVRGDRGRWGSAALATGCLVLAVVTVRMVATSRA